eukprot:scpid81125/ scgid22735/ 
MDASGKKVKPPISAVDMAAHLKLMSEHLASASKSLREAKNNSSLNEQEFESHLDDILDSAIMSSSVLMCSLSQLPTVNRQEAGLLTIEKSLADCAPILLPGIQ